MKFDLQGIATWASLLVAIVAFGFSLKSDISTMQVTIDAMKERSVSDRDGLKRDIWRVEQKVNEITKTVVK